MDFVVKPVDDSELLDAVGRALTRAVETRQQRRAQTDSAARIARLTARERQVIHLVAVGLLNKQIAFELGISEETVKVHRGHAMRKLEVDSVPALIRLLIARSSEGRSIPQGHRLRLATAFRISSSSHGLLTSGKPDWRIARSKEPRSCPVMSTIGTSDPAERISSANSIPLIFGRQT